MKIETKCLHSGYMPKDGEPCTIPIIQSTTYRYHSCNAVADIFDDPTLGAIYSRFFNPTCDAVEKKIADMEGMLVVCLLHDKQQVFLRCLIFVGRDSFIASNITVEQ